MPTFDLTINIFTFLVIMGLAAVFGFWVRSRQLRRKDRRIAALEQDVLYANAEVLQAQKEYCDLESTIRNLDIQIPVISMKLAGKEDERGAEKSPERAGEEKNRPTRTG